MFNDLSKNEIDPKTKYEGETLEFYLKVINFFYAL